MGQNTHITRKQGEIPFSEGSTKGLKLDKTHFYTKLELLIDWDVTVNTADTDRKANGILELLQNIELKYNNSKTPKSLSLPMLHFLNWYREGQRPRADLLDLSTASQQSGKIQANINFLLPSAGRPQTGTMMPGWAFSDWELRVKWGNASDIAADVTINDATVEVQAKQKRKSAVKNPKKTVNEDLSVFYENERAVAVTQDGITTVEMPVGDVYKAVAFQIQNGGDPDASLVEGITVEDNATNTHFDTSPSLLRNKDRQDHGVDELAPGFGIIDYGVYPEEVFDASDRDTYEIQFETDGVPVDPARIEVVEQLII